MKNKFVSTGIDSSLHMLYGSKRNFLQVPLGNGAWRGVSGKLKYKPILVTLRCLVTVHPFTINCLQNRSYGIYRFPQKCIISDPNPYLELLLLPFISPCPLFWDLKVYALIGSHIITIPLYIDVLQMVSSDWAGVGSRNWSSTFDVPNMDSLYRSSHRYRI